MTAKKKSEKFYQELQKKFSRKIDLDLKRIKLALRKLNNLHLKMSNVIGIYGSDGKNACIASLKSFIEANSQSLTCYTSPHLYDVRSRFYHKNKFVSLEELKKNIHIIEKLNVRLTLFELLTLSHVISCTKLSVDYHLLEGGAGQNLDSTNLWSSPLAQVITNINRQHTKLFGVRTLRQICKIKVGSLSKSTNIYIGKQNLQTLKIIKQILKKNPSRQVYYGTGWTVKKISNNKRIYKDNGGKIILQNPNILSDGLWDNIGLSIRIARDLNISKKIILKGVNKLFFEGRMHFIKKGPLRKLLYSQEDLCLDGCHSETSIKNHVSTIKNIKKPKFAIWSLGENREPEQYVKHLKIFKKLVSIKIPGEPNSCSPQLLKKIANKHNIECFTAPNIISAIQALSSSKPKVISIIGSLYTVGKVLNLNS